MTDAGPEESPKSAADLQERAGTLLGKMWAELIGVLADAGTLPDTVEASDLVDIRLGLSEKSQTFPYVLPTQLAAKVVDPELDARCLQKEEDGGSAAPSGYQPSMPGERFDPRSLCSKVVVPWNNRNGNALGRSADPYVSKPLRTPWLTIDTPHRSKVKQTEIWDAMARVLQHAHQDTAFAERAFRQVITELARKSLRVSIEYLPPKRVPVETVVEAVNQILGETSGGAAAQAVVAGLMATLGRHFGIWDEVTTEHVNVADVVSGRPADVICLSKGKVRLACEVKGRQIKLDEIDQKLIDLRGKDVEAALFLVKTGPSDGNPRDILRKHFASGLDAQVMDLLEFGRPLFFLLGPAGRHDFLKEVGSMLDRMKVQLPIRRRWADILRLSSA